MALSALVCLLSVQVRTFRDATAFNGDISMWDVRKVTSLEQFMYNANAFNRVRYLTILRAHLSVYVMSCHVISWS